MLTTRYKVWSCILPLTPVLFLAASEPAHANLLTNGSFEIGAPPSGCVAGTTSLSGWTVSAGNIDIDSITCSGIAAADGTYWVDLTGSFAGINDVGTIVQSVSTQVGQRYGLSFYFGGNPQWQTLPYPNDSPIKSMNVLLNDLLVANYTVNTAGVASTNAQWNLDTLYFTATSANTQIDFQSLNGITTPSDFGPLLDGVNLTAVPEPPSAWLLLSGLVGFGAMFRGRKQTAMGCGS